jgi:DNA-nicking Smr family endonuclease
MTDKKLTDEDKGLWFDVAKSIKPLWARAMGRNMGRSKKKSVIENNARTDRDDGHTTYVSDVNFVDMMAHDNAPVSRDAQKKNDNQKIEISSTQQNTWQHERVDFEKENQVFLEVMGLGERIKSTPVSHTDPPVESVPQYAAQELSQEIIHDAGVAWVEEKNLSRGDKKRIKQGVLKPTRSLDLHGYTVMRAEKTIPQFLAQAQRDGHQIVEIITGHGRFKISDEGTEKGILKRLLPTWLSKPLNRHMIKRVMDAPYSRGGAVWVMLRVD